MKKREGLQKKTWRERQHENLPLSPSYSLPPALPSHDQCQCLCPGLRLPPSLRPSFHLAFPPSLPSSQVFPLSSLPLFSLPLLRWLLHSPSFSFIFFPPPTHSFLLPCHPLFLFSPFSLPFLVLFSFHIFQSQCLCFPYLLLPSPSLPSPPLLSSLSTLPFLPPSLFSPPVPSIACLSSLPC